VPTHALADPVDALFGTQLGDGTDIERVLASCQGLVKRPQETIFVLISDLYEGGNVAQMLALDDNGAPSYDHRHAAHFASLGIPCFAGTPDTFPDLMAAAIKKQDMKAWAAQHA
jgi:hypothetical protein